MFRSCRFRSGFEITDAHDEADAVVINTCAFVEDAKSESIDTIVEAARLKEDGTVRKVVVTGCLAQRYSEELASQLPEADLVVGFERYGGLAGSLREVLGAPPELDMDEYAQRARVQVRGGWGDRLLAGVCLWKRRTTGCSTLGRTGGRAFDAGRHMP